VASVLSTISGTPASCAIACNGFDIADDAPGWRCSRKLVFVAREIADGQEARIRSTLITIRPLYCESIANPAA